MPSRTTPLTIQWTPAQDATIRTMRAAGKPWHTIGAAIGVGRNSVVNRGITLGLPSGPLSRAVSVAEVVQTVRSGVCTYNAIRKAGAQRYSDEIRHALDPYRDERLDPYTALRAGHPATWTLLTKGTCLEGASYGSATHPFYTNTQRGRVTNITQPNTF